MILIIYDISDNNIRNKIAEILKDFGLERIQKSAFIGELNPLEREKIASILKRFVVDENDRIDIFFICNRDIKLHKKITIKGIKNDL